jgi:hypothetical protein
VETSDTDDTRDNERERERRGPESRPWSSSCIRTMATRDGDNSESNSGDRGHLSEWYRDDGFAGGGRRTTSIIKSCQLFERLTMLSNQLEFAINLSGSLQAHSAAQSTVSALELKATEAQAQPPLPIESPLETLSPNNLPHIPTSSPFTKALRIAE